MGKLTKAQKEFLGLYLQGGWTISDPVCAYAPERRLIKRRLISRTGTHQGRPFFSITSAGRAALEVLK